MVKQIEKLDKLLLPMEKKVFKQEKLNTKLNMENNTLYHSIEDLKQKYNNANIAISHLKNEDILNKNLTNELIENNALLKNKLFATSKKNEDKTILVASLKYQFQKCKK